MSNLPSVTSLIAMLRSLWEDSFPTEVCLLSPDPFDTQYEYREEWTFDDPIYKHLNRYFDHGFWGIFKYWLLSATVCAIPQLIGFLLPLFFHPVSSHLFPITDYRIWPNELAITTLWYPFVWTIYLWQPRAIRAVISSLYSGDPDSRVVSAPLQLSRRYRPRLRLLSAALVAFGFMLMWSLEVATQFNSFHSNKVGQWFQQSTALTSIVIVVAFFHIYMLAWIVMRQYTYVKSLNLALESKRTLGAIKPVLYHRDRKSGLSIVANYAAKSIAITSCAFAWIFFIAFYPRYLDAHENLRVDSIIYLLALVFAAILLIVVPYSRIIARLSGFKSDMKSPIYQRMQQVSANDIDPTKLSQLQELSTCLDLIDTAISVWVFSRRDLLVGAGAIFLAATEPVVTSFYQSVPQILADLFKPSAHAGEQRSFSLTQPSPTVSPMHPSATRNQPPR